MPFLAALSFQAWIKIGFSLALAVAIAIILIQRTTISETKRDRDEYALKLSVSNASIRSMKTDVARMVAEQKALANSDANRMNASRQNLQIVAAVAKVRDATIDKLNASAKIIRPVDTSGQCTASPTLLENWPV